MTEESTNSERMVIPFYGKSEADVQTRVGKSLRNGCVLGSIGGFCLTFALMVTCFAALNSPPKTTVDTVIAFAIILAFIGAGLVFRATWLMKEHGTWLVWRNKPHFPEPPHTW